MTVKVRLADGLSAARHCYVWSAPHLPSPPVLRMGGLDPFLSRKRERRWYVAGRDDFSLHLSWNVMSGMVCDQRPAVSVVDRGGEVCRCEIATESDHGLVGAVTDREFSGLCVAGVA